MNKCIKIEKVKDSFHDIAEFSEYAQHCEDLIIEILSYLSMEGLNKILQINKDIRKQMNDTEEYKRNNW